MTAAYLPVGRQRHDDLATRRRAQRGGGDVEPVGDVGRVETESVEFAQGERGQSVAAALVAGERRLVDHDDRSALLVPARSPPTSPPDRHRPRRRRRRVRRGSRQRCSRPTATVAASRRPARRASWCRGSCSGSRRDRRGRTGARTVPSVEVPSVEVPSVEVTVARVAVAYGPVACDAARVALTALATTAAAGTPRRPGRPWRWCRDGRRSSTS